MDFSDTSQALKSHGINESNNKVGSYLKLLAPEGQEIKIKASNGVRHYKLKWRSRFNNGNQGTPYQLKIGRNNSSIPNIDYGERPCRACRQHNPKD